MIALRINAILMTKEFFQIQMAFLMASVNVAFNTYFSEGNT